MVERSKSWWARNKKLKPQLDRPYKLLAVVATVVITMAIFERLLMAQDMKPLREWLKGSAVFGDLLFPDPAKIDWKDRLQGVVLLLGLPVAFCLWHWRDKNVREQIENARKDINLKEFLEVQKMAAGLFDKGMDEHAQTDLQVAALHQLSDYLGDDHPKSFRRAAFEMLWPSDGISEEKVQSFGEWCSALNTSATENAAISYQEYVDGQFAKLDRVALARIALIHDEWRKYFRSGFPLNGRDFSFLKLPIDADLSKLYLPSCRFIRSGIERVKFNEANLRFAVFDRTFAAGASFNGAAMFGAHIECSGLMCDNREGVDPFSQPVDLRGANLSVSRLRNSVASGALLQGSSLPGNLEGMDFEDAVFDNATQIALGLSSNQHLAADTLRKLGAKHEDET